MLTAERRKIIARLLDEQGAVQVADLSARFGVSASTIRRDLQKLARQGLIERAYGGATRRSEKEPASSGGLAAEIKTQIGQAAASLVEPGETLFLNAGSTTLAVARALAERSDLTIITNDLAIAAFLAEHSKASLVVVGGLVNREAGVMAGHLAEQALESLHADKVILDVQGITTPDGLTSDDLLQVRMAQMLLDAIPEAIVVADHTKFGRVCTARIAPVDRIDIIVTDRNSPDAMLWELAELEIKIILA